MAKEVPALNPEIIEDAKKKLAEVLQLKTNIETIEKNIELIDKINASFEKNKEFSHHTGYANTIGANPKDLYNFIKTGIGHHKAEAVEKLEGYYFKLSNMIKV